MKPGEFDDNSDDMDLDDQYDQLEEEIDDVDYDSDEDEIE